MTRLLLSLSVCAALCGCAKKSRSTTADNPPVAQTGGARPNVVAPVVPTPTRPALPEGWVEFRHPDGAYTVFLPAPPRPIEVSAGSNLNQPVPTGRALMSDHAAQAAGLYCETGAAVYSPELVEGVRAAMERKRVSGKNGNRAPVTWAGHPAFEDTPEDPENGRLTVKRWMWVGNRLYYCTMYGQAAGRPTAAERAATFDSFVVGS